MAFPHASRERLSGATIQKWTLSLVLRHFPGYVVGLTVLELATMYSLVAAVVFLLSALSDNFLGSMGSLLPSLAEAITRIPFAGFYLSGAMFAVHVLAGLANAFLLRRFSVAVDEWLKLNIIRNTHLWIAPREAFASPGSLERRISSLIGRSRASTRSARAMVSIFPSVIFLVTAVVALLALFPAALIWLTVLGAISVVLQRFANTRIIGLEREYARLALANRAEMREHIRLYSAADPSDTARARRGALDARIGNMSARYFSRNLLTNLTRIASFGTLVAVSFVFLAVVVVSQPQMMQAGLVETFVLLLIVARTIVSAISGIAANQAILAKYAYHAHQTFLYFHGPAQRARPSTRRITRLVGPEPLSAYGVSYYLDGLNDLLQTDLRQWGNVAHESDAIIYRPKSGPEVRYAVTVVPEDNRDGVQVGPGDHIVLYDRVLGVGRTREIPARQMRKLFRWSKARARELKDELDSNAAAADEDDDIL